MVDAALMFEQQVDDPLALGRAAVTCTVAVSVVVAAATIRGEEQIGLPTAQRVIDERTGQHAESRQIEARQHGRGQDRAQFGRRVLGKHEDRSDEMVVGVVGHGGREDDASQGQ